MCLQVKGQERNKSGYNSRLQNQVWRKMCIGVIG